MTSNRALSTRLDDRARLAILVTVSAIVLGLVALGAPGPRIFPDELIYMDAASELADGNSPSVRGEDYRYGPVYPAVVAPLIWVAGDRESAFPLIQLLNALAFALVAVPVFLLATRVASRGWALVAAALAVLVPSSVYAMGVLTESVAYLAFAFALLAMTRVIERPSITRQVVALGAIAIAAGVRTQFLLLAPVYVAVLLGSALVLPSSGTWLRRLWPTAVVVALVGLGLVAFLATGGSFADLLGSYDVLWRRYDLGELTRWGVRHLGLFVLYVVVAPVVVAPIELRRWWRRGRAGSAPHTALLLLTVLATAATIAVVAAFATTTYAGGVLHDRGLFYAAPLWFIVLCGWLSSGMPRPVAALATGGVIAFALVAALPYTFVRTILWETVALEPWQFVERGNPAGTPFSGREAMILFTLVAIAAVVFVPRASRWTIVALVSGMLLFTSSLAWAHALEGSQSINDSVFAPGDDRSWLDAIVPPGTSATLLTIDTVPCHRDVVTRSARLTEFFNDAVGPGAHLEDLIDPLAPPDRLVVLRGRVLVDAETGAPLHADVVVAPAEVRIRGTRLGSGTRAPLVAWRTDGSTVEVVSVAPGAPCRS